jgi:hypothetical protein
MKQWYSSVYKGFIYAGIISFIIGLLSPINVAINAYIAGYIVFVLAILMIIIILFNNLFKDSTFQAKLNSQSSIMKRYSSGLYSIVLTSAPFMLLISVIGFMLYLMIKYKNKIISGHISPNYNLYSNLATFLLMSQMYIIYKNISNEESSTTYVKFSNVTASLLFLTEILFAINSIIIYTILKYFTTDGFIN